MASIAVTRRFLALGLVVLLAGCTDDAPQPEAGADQRTGPLVVFATSYPLAFFAERIGGALVRVVFPAPPGVDPAHWNADAETIAQAQAADLLLRHGAGDPAWLELASLHGERIVDTTAGARDRLLQPETALHQHGPEGEHSHRGWAGTTWLDPALAIAEAEALAGALIGLRPEDEEQLRSNLAGLVADLRDLDQALADAAAALGDTPLLFSHPVYSYLQARYGLNGRSVVWEPDALSNERQWRALGELLQEHPARTMLWEAEPLPETVERLAALGIESRVYAPCASRPAAGDWLAVMGDNRRTLEELGSASR
jgi:zinc transport system substrate-binding protein